MVDWYKLILVMDKILIYYKQNSVIEKNFDMLNKSDKECAIFCLAYFKNNKLFLKKLLYNIESAYENCIVIDNKLLLKLLIFSAKEKNAYPCLIHSHVNYHSLKFSIDDLEYEKSCNIVLDSIGGKNFLWYL